MNEATTKFEFTSEIIVNPIDCLGSDKDIAKAALVLDPLGELPEEYKDKDKWEKKVDGIINYMLKHKHGSAYEHNCIRLYVDAPIVVWREWHRHRIGFSYNEESGRYSVLRPKCYIPPRDRPMMKVDEWKPARPKFTRCEDEDTYTNLCESMKVHYRACYQGYQYHLSLGVDPGLARNCLPVEQFSRCWVTCNLRSALHYLSLRTFEPDAKFVSYPLYEIEVAARKLEEFVKEKFPITYKHFNANGRVAP